MWEQGVLAWRFRAARTAGLYRRALSDSVPEPARGPRARRVRTSRSADRAFFALDILRFGVRLLRLYSIFRCLALEVFIRVVIDRLRSWAHACDHANASCTTSSRPDTRADGKKRPAATQARPRAGSLLSMLLSPYNPPEGHTSKTKRPHRHISRVLGGTSVARVVTRLPGYV